MLLIFLCMCINWSVTNNNAGYKQFESNLNIFINEIILYKVPVMVGTSLSMVFVDDQRAYICQNCGIPLSAPCQ